jgi:hypothetical protein
MTDPSSPPSLDRIDQAMARIAAAIDHRAGAHLALRRRHARLREKVGETIAALDALIHG